MQRRHFLQMATLLSVVGATSSGQAQSTTEMTRDQATRAAAEAHERLMQVPGIEMHGTEQIAILLYPGFTALDAIGPHFFLACMMGATIHLITTEADLAPVVSDLGLAIALTVRLDDCPASLDLVLVPGGSTGTLAAARNPAVLDLLRRQERAGRLLASVCTGALVLGAAGLLKGRRATGHWVIRDVLPAFGAIPDERRVVRDGVVMTAAGVTAGIDLGLSIVEALRGRPYGQALMLQAEYAPEPPFTGGTLANTDPVIAEPIAGMFTEFLADAMAIARGVR